MSLQLWLPLINDTHNQGLSNYTITTLGTLSWVTGKLGATAMRAGDGTQIINGLQINNNFTELLNGDYSVSVWIKPYGTHVHYNGSIMSSGNWNTANKRWAFGVSQDNTKVDVLGYNYNTYINCTVPENEWTHLICTCGSDRKIKLYKNGEYIGVRDGSSDPAIDSDASVTCIGRESYANGYFSFNGAIQDLRLYDHCLSLEEIRRLSQGLILHFPLNRNGWGQQNLAIKTGNRAPDETSQVEWRAFKLGVLPITTNEVLTVSFDIEMHIGTAVNGYPYLLVYNTNRKGPHAGWISKTNSSSNPMIPSGNYAIGDTIKCRCVTTITTPSSFTAGTQTEDWIEFYSNYDTENEFTITNIKIEKGSRATPWCLNSSDTLYTSMNINETIEYDYSGYDNKGTRTGTFTWASDTPKYNVSSVQTGSNYISLTSPSAEILTIALWVKWDTIPSGQSVILVDNNSGIGLGLMSTGILCSTSSAGNSYTFSKANLVADTWYHFVIVKIGKTIRKLYINGVEQTATSNTSNWTYSVNQMQIGKRSTTSDGFVGKLCDFRAYATALSANDIKSLYQNSAYVDNSGNVYGAIH